MAERQPPLAIALGSFLPLGYAPWEPPTSQPGMFPKMAQITKNSQLGRYAISNVWFPVSAELRGLLGYLFSAPLPTGQLSGLVSAVRIPALALCSNCLPSTSCLPSNNLPCPLLHRENRCPPVGGRSASNVSVPTPTLPSLDLSPQMNPSTHLCFRSKPCNIRCLSFFWIFHLCLLLFRF